MFASHSLKRKILMPLVAVLAVALTLIAIQHASSYRASLATRLNERAEHLADIDVSPGGGIPGADHLQQSVIAHAAEADVKVIVVVDGEPARVIASSDVSLLGQTVDEIANVEFREELRKAAQTKGRVSYFDLEGRDFDYIRPLASSDDGPGVRAGRGGGVLVSLDTSRLRSEVAAVTLRALGAYLIGAVMVACCCWLLLQRYVFRPLLTIERTMSEFSGEHRGSLIATTFPGELGLVADAWNRLVNRLHREHDERVNAEESLRLNRDQLEERVLERTSELARSNHALQETITQLEESRNMLRTIIETIPVRVFWKDADLVYLGCNTLFARDAGLYDPSEVAGKDDFALTWKEQAEWYRSDDRRVIDGACAEIHKIEPLTGPDGGTTWLNTSKVPLKGRDGSVIGVLGIYEDITAQKLAEAERAGMNEQLISSSRRAGMAEVAISVLHNVGNVLNSVNVSAEIASEKIRGTSGSDLARVAALLESHRDDLQAFIGTSQGKQLPGFLSALAAHFSSERQVALAELKLLISNIDHIKQIVAMQQSHARFAASLEELPAAALVEEALSMNSVSIEGRGIEVVRDFEDTPPLKLDKHKALQILVNLIRNAKHAMSEKGAYGNRLTLGIRHNDAGQVEISVADEGLGIAPEHLQRIFEHGFTLRKAGHGFGLHSAALAAREMMGTVKVHSKGLGHGAMFTLVIPHNTAPIP